MLAHRHAQPARSHPSPELQHGVAHFGVVRAKVLNHNNKEVESSTWVQAEVALPQTGSLLQGAELAPCAVNAALDGGHEVLFRGGGYR